MGICPRCGSWIDAGEPYCPDCSYIINDSSSDEEFSDDGVISINGFEYDVDDVVDALDELGYDLDDLKSGLVDEDELEEILDDF